VSWRLSSIFVPLACHLGTPLMFYFYCAIMECTICEESDVTRLVLLTPHSHLRGWESALGTTKISSTITARVMIFISSNVGYIALDPLHPNLSGVDQIHCRTVDWYLNYFASFIESYQPPD